MTLKEKAIEWRATRPNAPLAEMPGFAEWVDKNVHMFAGRIIARNGADYGMTIAGRHYQDCTWVDDPAYEARLNKDGSVTVFRNGRATETLPLERDELIRLVGKRIDASWHPR